MTASDLLLSAIRGLDARSLERLREVIANAEAEADGIHRELEGATSPHTIEHARTRLLCVRSWQKEAQGIVAAGLTARPFCVGCGIDAPGTVRCVTGGRASVPCSVCRPSSDPKIREQIATAVREIEQYAPKGEA